jgi:hypothetical protein
MSILTTNLFGTKQWRSIANLVSHSLSFIPSSFPYLWKVVLTGIEYLFGQGIGF